MKIFCAAMLLFASIAVPLQLLMSACIVDSAVLEMLALYMHAV